jgi:hypothetical protein
VSEKDIQVEILRALAGDRRLRLWRANSGKAVSFDGKRVVSFGVPGQADLTGVLQDGRRLEVEVKDEHGRQSQQQLAYMRMIREYKGVYILARSPQEVLDELNRLTGN